ncbi:hypothetical protein ACJW31_09G055600 [Castanea mollissima]
MENRDLGIRFGPKDALFQVYEQNDSLAAVACGLGGGSLVNAGVMLPTPVCARRNPKWPKEWEGDWDHCEASAVAMLRTQSIPIKFHAAKVLGEIVDEQIENLFETSVKLSMNFDLEESMANSKTPQKMDSCLACGNCLAGCPYNAKSSTDKNYLVSAIQNAVLPTAYPHLLFKGITTYGWPTGYWFFHGTIDKIRHIIGLKASQAIVLNAMGYDESDGKIMMEKDMNRICFSPPHDPLLPKKIEAFQKLRN